jgi:hypothetical protein
MKSTLFILLTFSLLRVSAQTYEGNYGQGDTAQFQILRRSEGLVFHTEHYGNIRMLPQGPGRFTLESVKPPILMVFETDGSGKVSVFFHQKGRFTWLRDDSASGTGPTGRYHQDIDRYAFLHVRQDSGRLYIEQQEMIPAGKNMYKPLDTALKDRYVFSKDKVVMEKDGVQAFRKLLSTAVLAPIKEHISDRSLGFNREDTLEGMPTPVRTCYDVLFYDLSVKVDVAGKMLGGHNRIRFRAVRAFDSLQIDLYATLRIDSILFRGQSLSYTREYNAVYVHFPRGVPQGATGEIDVYYGGKPAVPDPSVLAGGIIWYQDKNDKPWVESVTQGSGGSVWWPCKDLLSDKPDSMRISVTVPRGLTDVSNGRFLGKTELPGDLTRFDWYVSYPILNYNVAINIGDYVRDTFPGVDCYYLSYHPGPARKVFAGAVPMLALCQRDFGAYPFAGFTLVEAPYPMEHQEVVSIGPIDGVDPAEVTRTMWHESAHEWWGNSVSCSDFADLWIHEAFATYTEVLAYRAFVGEKAASRYLREQVPENKEPVIGVYGVNYFHLGDMYSKGCLLLNTMQHVIGNDSLWFSILRGIQKRFRYKSVTTEDIVRCFNELSGADYTRVFDQYLRYTAIPEFQYSLAGNRLRYRWKADVPGFHMAIRTRDVWLHGTTEWQEVTLAHPSEFGVDTEDYYVRVTLIN